MSSRTRQRLLEHNMPGRKPGGGRRTTSRKGFEIRQRQYQATERNLVLRTDNRITMMDQADEEAIKEDGKHVAQFLGVQLWDVI